jgi:urocanate hydratase
LGARHRAGFAFNAMAGAGELDVPIVIVRDRDHVPEGGAACRR